MYTLIREDESPADATRRLIAQAHEAARLGAEWQKVQEAYKQPLRVSHGAPINHGAKGYRRGCRCDECRSGYAQYMKEYRHRTGRTLSENKRTHGIPGTYYVLGCRCELCKIIGKATNRKYRERRKKKNG